jgi:hypothetical protein
MSGMIKPLSIAAVLLAAIALAGCWESATTWHRKLTLTVSTPTGDVSASVVRLKEMREDPVVHSAHSGERGEALVLEVAPGRYLFALIEENKPQEELLFFPGEPPLLSTRKLDAIKGKAIDIPLSQYPMLVTFGDITEPKSVRKVDLRDLSASFGSGHRLKSFTVEITNEPVTEGKVEQVLSWLGQLNGSYLHGGFTSKGAPLGLHGGNFTTGYPQ